jgi:hypothetical protein
MIGGLLQSRLLAKRLQLFSDAFKLAGRNSEQSTQRRNNGIPYQFIPPRLLRHVTRARVETFFQHDYPREDDIDLVPHTNGLLRMCLSKGILTGRFLTDRFTISKNRGDCPQGDFERIELLCVFVCTLGEFTVVNLFHHCWSMVNKSRRRDHPIAYP